MSNRASGASQGPSRGPNKDGYSDSMLPTIAGVATGLVTDPITGYYTRQSLKYGGLGDLLGTRRNEDLMDSLEDVGWTRDDTRKLNQPWTSRNRWGSLLDDDDPGGETRGDSGPIDGANPGEYGSGSMLA